MPIYEVRLVQRVSGQLAIMGFNYLSSGTPAAVSRSFALAKAMGFAPTTTTLETGTIARLLQIAQGTQVEFILASVRDVYSNTDFYESPFLPATNGTYAGEAGSPFEAYAFTSSKSRYDIRRGQRRVAGVTETGVGPGGAITSAQMSTNLVPLATAFSAVLSYNDEGNPLTFEPIIVSKESIPPAPPKYPNTRYRYYEDQNVQMQHIMTSIVWTPQDFVTTQNSRKRGRGA
jgi:hypothetical protein